MGEQKVEAESSQDELRLFTKRLLNDVHALDYMLHHDMIESGVRRIGAEQELFLVNDHWLPAPTAMEILKDLADPQFTTELARFNLEFNLDPTPFGEDCLSQLEQGLTRCLKKVRRVANEHDCEILTTGILPTLMKSDLSLDNMSPRPRYKALNDAICRLRGSDYEFHIRGVDEVIVQHDSVMLESCNTSFQLHFQVGPEEFAKLYNIAQLITGPLLAACVNSPLLFGRRLWRETRIALFQQAVDTRRATPFLREAKSRVSFGTHWIRDSVLEIFREDIARYRVLLGAPVDEDPFAVIRQGKPPQLQALCLHNSTVYRWNRPCYGISNGKAHLRIENRVLPSGPTVVDAVANAAFYFGLMSAVSNRYEDVSTLLDFSHVRNNFVAAAHQGLQAQFTWLDGRIVPAQKLICDTLLPLARKGLKERSIDSEDATRFLDVFEERVVSCTTGAQWMLRSLESMKGQGSPGEQLAALTAAMVRRQKEGSPVHQWSLAQIDEAGGWKPSYLRVEQFMTTDLVTVTAEDTLELVANLMDWEKIRHIPVEDAEHHLVGLISYRSVFRYFAEHLSRPTAAPIPVTSVMVDDPITVSPETSTLDAIETMRSRQIGCLPVVKEGKLVGILTERDFMAIARELIERKLRE